MARISTPFHSIGSSPVAGTAVGVGVPMGGRDAALDLMDTLQATGASMEQSLGLAAAALGVDAVRPHFIKAAEALEGPFEVVVMLEAVAAGSHDVANQWLGECLTTGCVQPWDADGLHGLHLANCDWITSLPDGLVVEGVMDLHGCTSLTRLPAGLRVHGWLNLAGCTGLEALPEGLEAHGDLMLDQCTSLQRLPERMTVGQTLHAKGCAAWDGRIPKGVALRADMHPDPILKAVWTDAYPFGTFLETCRREWDADDVKTAAGAMDALKATGVPPGEAMGMVAAMLGPDAVKSAYLARVAHLRKAVGEDRSDVIVELLGEVAQGSPETANAWLNEGLASGEIEAWEYQYEDGGGLEQGRVGLNFDQHPWITSLPDGLVVRGDLILHESPALAQFPEGLDVEGCLEVHGCPDLVALPASMKVGHWIHVADCPSLRSLPDCLATVDSSLYLENCPSLERLPDNLRVKHKLYLAGCSSLQELPSGLKVGGDVILTGCRSLERLPSDLRMRGNHLDMKGCASWDGIIPDDPRFQVRGKIFTDNFPDGFTVQMWRFARAEREGA